MVLDVGDLIAHKLYVNSKGIIVDQSEKEYIIYYIDGLGNDRYQTTNRKDDYIKICDISTTLKDEVIERYNLHLEEILLKKRKQESKDKILKELSLLLR